MMHWVRPHWACPPVCPPPVLDWPGCSAQPWLYACNPCRAPGTGLLPGSIPPTDGPCPPVYPTHDQYLEAWRAWQRRVGYSDPIQRPLPGCSPPNYFRH